MKFNKEEVNTFVSQCAGKFRANWNDKAIMALSKSIPASFLVEYAEVVKKSLMKEHDNGINDYE